MSFNHHFRKLKEEDLNHENWRASCCYGLKRLCGEIPIFHGVALALALFNGFRRFGRWHDDTWKAVRGTKVVWAVVVVITVALFAIVETEKQIRRHLRAINTRGPEPLKTKD